MIQVEREVRKSEKPMVHPHQLMAQHHSGKSTQNGAAGDHDEGKLQVMNDDLPIRKTKSFKNRDLFPLQIQQTRQHGVGHKCSHTEKHQRKAY